MRASSGHRHRFRSASLCCHETIEQNYIRRGCIVPSYEGTSAFHTCIRIFSVKCFAELVIARMRERDIAPPNGRRQGGLARLEFPARSSGGNGILFGIFTSMTRFPSNGLEKPILWFSCERKVYAFRKYVPEIFRRSS